MTKEELTHNALQHLTEKTGRDSDSLKELVSTYVDGYIDGGMLLCNHVSRIIKGTNGDGSKALEALILVGLTCKTFMDNFSQQNSK